MSGLSTLGCTFRSRYGHGVRVLPSVLGPSAPIRRISGRPPSNFENPSRKALGASQGLSLFQPEMHQKSRFCILRTFVPRSFL